MPSEETYVGAAGNRKAITIIEVKLSYILFASCVDCPICRPQCPLIRDYPAKALAYETPMSGASTNWARDIYEAMWF